MESAVAESLAQNVRLLREKRGLSQAQIAKIAGVPRATWTHLESGESNPTLAVLLKVAAALQVRLEELLGPSDRGARLYPAAGLPERRRGAARIRRLLPDSLAGMEIERMELPAGASFTGVPHTPGTREWLTCERGEIELIVDGRQLRLAPGDVAVFRGDQRHGYKNPGARAAVAYSVVAFAPIPG